MARTGGDEFVILAPGASLEEAAALAQRVRAAVTQPTRLCGTDVTVGVTIGVAHADGALTEATLAGADDALLIAKARARGTVRWRVHPAELRSRTPPRRQTGSTPARAAASGRSAPPPGAPAGPGVSATRCR